MGEVIIPVPTTPLRKFVSLHQTWDVADCSISILDGKSPRDFMSQASLCLVNGYLRPPGDHGRRRETLTVRGLSLPCRELAPKLTLILHVFPLFPPAASSWQ